MGNSISKSKLETEEEVRKKEKFNKQSVDYDDTDFLQKMFSNGDNEIKNIEGEKLKLSDPEEFKKKQRVIASTPQATIVKRPNDENDLLSKKIGAHKGNSVIQNDSDPLQDEDIMKIDRLQLINASARYQLLSANQQLLDFHLSRIMQSKLKQKNQTR